MNASGAKTFWRAITILVVLGIFLWLIIAQPWRPAEPVYKGKPLTYWLMQYHRELFRDYFHPLPKGVYPDPQALNNVMMDASRAAQHCGSNAVPVLLEMAGAAPDSTLKLMFIVQARKQSLVKLNLCTQADYQRLANLGFMSLDKDSTRSAVPGLIRLLHSKDASTRWFVENILRLPNIAPNAGEAVPALIDRLDDPDAAVREFATRALGDIHEHPSLVVPALTKKLQGYTRTNTTLDLATLEALMRFGTNARPAVPVITQLIGNEDPIICVEAKEALKKIAPEVLTTNTDR